MRTDLTDGLIGVDGGGTSCRVALLVHGKRADVRVGSANVTTDLPAAVATISEGLKRAAATVGLSLADIKDIPAYLGLAGVTGPRIAHQVTQALPLTNAWVADDRVVAVAGALAEADGTLIGMGTGSFLARQQGGTVRLMGGYGLILGDEGSGGWLGRALLGRVLRISDGLEPPSGLTDRVFSDFGRDTAAIVAFARTATPAEFGRFAPDLVAAATAGDPVGHELMQAGVGYILQGVRVLGWTPGEPICLMGSLATHYAAYLPESLTQAVMGPKGSALDGALALAARHARSQGEVPT